MNYPALLLVAFAVIASHKVYFEQFNACD